MDEAQCEEKLKLSTNYSLICPFLGWRERGEEVEEEGQTQEEGLEAGTRKALRRKTKDKALHYTSIITVKSHTIFISFDFSQHNYWIGSLWQSSCVWCFQLYLNSGELISEFILSAGLCEWRELVCQKWKKLSGCH